MIKFIISNGLKEHPIKFDEDKIIEDNNLFGEYEERIVDEIKQAPTKTTTNSLEYYGGGAWFASGSNFGIVKAGAEILFDEDKNDSQGGGHFTVQPIVRVDGQKPYKIPAGEAHRIYSNSLKVTFFNLDGTVSGSKIINKDEK